MDAIVAVVDSRNMHPYRQPMRRAAVVCFGMIVALFLAATVTHASPAGSTPAQSRWFAASAGGIGGTPAQAGACAELRTLRERLAPSPGESLAQLLLREHVGRVPDGLV